MPGKINIDLNGNFCDSKGNIIVLRGVNLDPSVKYPSNSFSSTHFGSLKDGLGNNFYDDADKVSYIGHPLSLEDAEVHLNRLKSLGYNCIRLPITWDALEHEGPGIYDYAFMDYIIDLLKKIQDIGGLYVYLDPHQDVWSRFGGGSGAPLWTYHCCGMKPINFESTGAVILHNSYIDPKTGNEFKGNNYPNMLWPTNYSKLASQTMFTLFFAGKDFAPKCVINGENIQDYLQNHFIDAFLELYKRVQETAPSLISEDVLIALESMNEPNMGFLGERDLGIIPAERDLKLGPTPTGFQSFILGEGMSSNVCTYNYGKLGFVKGKDIKIDPKGKKAWLAKEECDVIDKKYNWIRGSEWVPGTCIWKLHGIWKHSDARNPELIKPDYFYNKQSDNSQQSEKIDEKFFINNYFVDYYSKLYHKFRAISETGLLIMQPPPLKEPPILKNADCIDNNTILACHFYDGMTLIYKTWNRIFNVDTLGITRKKYSNPVLSLSFGENNIRKSIKLQLKQMVEECKTHIGANVPVMFTEIGIPFNMNNKSSYDDGNYSRQIRALDALQFALEDLNISYSLWCYCHLNSHKWGDGWNNEDLSIWSADDMQLKNSKLLDIPNSPIRNMAKSSVDLVQYDPSMKNYDEQLILIENLDLQGFRALDALIRPFPLKINGSFRHAAFLLKDTSYRLEIDGNSSKDNTSCTQIYLPLYHFPISNIDISSSTNKVLLDANRQVLLWYHKDGLQYIKIELKNRSQNSCTIS
ncbi:hypothetical protein TPHA_0C01590 [Tetrapisispora phaffii CBS 4417]|uniref:Glycoside hydrolase family 5 domain-containing protein n=1 Tax=Tetrapisispora phaffii (strain ATCC 24235 / CBS 4417 / NBRC 1672 / NRRL Y-8282 / UCD 70-5) TaxID=1071381 RepID=G8BRD9_TETPH|nr:hypothetical protein TPHA_0C01590 [Tetrapisispora phaffii CBS 4417]CCE62315.1 hypothetical protein TPHA_0C01590 [Tetrapisispora phaffii CBS 4417]